MMIKNNFLANFSHFKNLKFILLLIIIFYAHFILKTFYRFEFFINIKSFIFNNFNIFHYYFIYMQ